MLYRLASPILSLALVLAATSPTFAQASPPPTAAASTPASSATPELDKQGRPKAKPIRAACKADAETKGLKGDDKRKAVMDCVVKQRPDLAAKEQCRLDGHAKGLKKDELKSFVKDCAKGKA